LTITIFHHITINSKLKFMPGYIKIVLMDETGKTINSSLCTTDGKLVFNQRDINTQPVIVQQILNLIKDEDISLNR